MQTICYLDMDDVLADFQSQAKKYLNYDCNTFKNKSYQEMTPQERTIQKQLFYYCDYDNRFWEEMPLRQGAKELYQFCLKQFDEVILLSRFVPPFNNKKRLEAVHFLKMQWAHRHLGTKNHLPNIIVFDKSKSLFVGASRNQKIQVLIDDMIKNVRDWEKQGGTGILYKDNRQTIQILKNMRFNISKQKISITEHQQQKSRD